MPLAAVRVRLNRWQREAPDQAVRSRDGRAVRRAQVIRLAPRGAPVREIAAVTGYAEKGARVPKHRRNERGQDAPCDSPRPGRPPKADESYRRGLRQTALTPPARLGHAFGAWTTARPAEHMTEETGARRRRVGRGLRAAMTRRRPGPPGAGPMGSRARGAHTSVAWSSRVSDVPNARYRKTRAAERPIEEIRSRVEVVWLPKYSSDLDDIERIWKTVKSTFFANAPYRSEEEFAKRVEDVVDRLHRDPDAVPGLMREQKAAA